MRKVLFVKGKLTTLYIANYKEYDKMSKMTDFATWLLKELEARDLTQTDLADYLDVSRQTVNYYIMKGDKKRPNDKVLYKIAKIRITCG